MSYEHESEYEQRPIRKSKCPVAEGDIITAECISKGDKGDGIFKVEGFIIIVPGTDIGGTYKIRITALRLKVAFGEIAE